MEIAVADEPLFGMRINRIVSVLVATSLPERSQQFPGVQGFPWHRSVVGAHQQDVRGTVATTAETQARQSGHALARRSECCARRNRCTPGRSLSNATIMRATL